MEYDKTGAKRIFAAEHLGARNDALSVHHKAGQEFLEALKDAAETFVRADFRPSDEGADILVVMNPRLPGRALTVRANRGRIEIAHAEKARKGEWTPVESVTFDPLIQAFVGVDLDADVAPTPGKPLPRRSAVTVVAEALMNLAGSDS